MFDKFVKAAHQTTTPRIQQALSRAPDQVLWDILSEKTACSFGHDNDHEWLEKFKNTPLLEQALKLQQSDIQNEIAEKKYRSEERVKSDAFWQNRDQISLQKRMLELQLAQQQMGGAAPAVGPEAGAGAPPEAAPEPKMGSDMRKQAIGEKMLGRGVAALQRMKAVNPEAAERAVHRLGTVASTAKVPHVARAAEELATHGKMPLHVIPGGAGEAAEQLMTHVAEANYLKVASMLMRKEALGMGNLAGMGTKALDLVKANPRAAAAIGTGLAGGAYGAATAKGENGQGPTMGQRLARGAGFGLGGAALGAGAAHVGTKVAPGIQDVRKRMAGGASFRHALGGSMDQGIVNRLGAAREKVMNLPSETVAKMKRDGLSQDGVLAMMDDGANSLRGFIKKHVGGLADGASYPMTQPGLPGIG